MTHTHISQNLRLGIRIALFLTLMLVIPLSLQIGYAQAATPGGSQPLQASAPRISKADAPSLCDDIRFSGSNPPVASVPNDAEVGDFNADGKPDIVAAASLSNTVSVLLGSGDGFFQDAANYPAGDYPKSVMVADLFGDRIDDLVIVDYSAQGVSYLQGVGDGTFLPPYFVAMGHRPFSGVIADLNSDTWPDLVTLDPGYTGSELSVRLNNQLGDFEPAIHATIPGGPYWAAVGDVNNDGKPDLVTSNFDSSTVSVLLGNGNGTFQAPGTFMVSVHPRKMAMSDLNGDSKLDLAIANSSDDVSVLLGNGDGSFQAATDFGVGSDPSDIRVADINDDGKLDLVTSNLESNDVSVLLGNGDGSFQAALNFGVGIDPHSVAVADFNVDGRLDLVTADKDTLDAGRVSVLLNGCTPITNTPTPTSMPTSMPTRTPGGPTATAATCAIQFADVPSDNTFYQYVRCLACRGIISGYACGGTGEPCNTNNDPYFRPSSPVSRGQLAKIVSNAAGYTDTVSGQAFEDVVPGSAFYTYAERLVAHDVMGGYACGGAGEPCGSDNLPYFRPSSGATRGQLTKIVSNAAAFTDPAPSTYTFTDVPVDSTFHTYVERLLLNRPGVMGGYACGGASEPCDRHNRAYFRPSSALTRGQTSKIVGNTFYPGCQTLGK